MALKAVTFEESAVLATNDRDFILAPDFPKDTGSIVKPLSYPLVIQVSAVRSSLRVRRSSESCYQLFLLRLLHNVSSPLQ